jgi:hypothetical protein
LKPREPFAKGRVESCGGAIFVVEKTWRNCRRLQEFIKIVSVNIGFDLLTPKIEVLLRELLSDSQCEIEVRTIGVIVGTKRLQRRWT